MVVQALLQSLLILITVNIFFVAPESKFISWPLAIALVSLTTLLTIGSQALMVSSLVKNSQQASSVAPLLLIPQLIFGGVLFVLGEKADDIYPLITSRWSMKLMGAFSNVTQLVPGGQSAIKALDGASAYEAMSSNIHNSFTVLFLQFFIFLALTFTSLLYLKHNK
jgi:ABC-type multidrug transport system permease subunit